MQTDAVGRAARPDLARGDGADRWRALKCVEAQVEGLGEVNGHGCVAAADIQRPGARRQVGDA